MAFRIAKPWPGPSHGRIALVQMDSMLGVPVLVKYLAPWGINIIIIVEKDLDVKRLYGTLAVQRGKVLVPGKYVSSLQGVPRLHENH